MPAAIVAAGLYGGGESPRLFEVFSFGKYHGSCYS